MLKFWKNYDRKYLGYYLEILNGDVIIKTALKVALNYISNSSLYLYVIFKYIFKGLENIENLALNLKKFK